MSSTELISQTAQKTTLKTLKHTKATAIIASEEKYTAKGLESLPVVLVRGQGAKVWDIDGKEAFHNGHYGPLCEKFCRATFGLRPHVSNEFRVGKVDLTIKISRKWSQKIKGVEENESIIVTIAGNYHGKSLGPLSASSNEYIRDGFGPYIPGVGPIIDGHIMRFSNIEDLNHAFEQQGDRTGAVILECVQGYAGCIPADNAYLKEAHALCKKYNALFVADEIQTRFGRIGYLMSYQAAGIKPDMITLGKALTGGAYSMRMVLGRKEAFDTVRRSRGNPLACAIASEAVDVVLD
ncbi:uncharacterized protein PV09_06706, partial [Verruconis gallopava]